MYGLSGVVEDVLATYPVGAVILTDGVYKEKQSDGTWKPLGYSTTSSGMTTVGPTREVKTGSGLTVTVSDLSFAEAQAQVLAEAKARAAAEAAARAAAATAAATGTGPAFSLAGGSTGTGLPIGLLVLGGAALFLLMGGRR